MYNNIIIIEDFNVGVEEPHMKTFCKNYSIKSLMKQPERYKNPATPICTDLSATPICTDLSRKNLHLKDVY